MADIDTYVMTSGKPTIKHDPNAISDYPFNWARWLTLSGGDTIASVVWILDSPLAKVSESFTATTATVFISGGLAGTILKITCRITTAGGRVEDRTIYLKVVER